MENKKQETPHKHKVWDELSKEQQEFYNTQVEDFKSGQIGVEEFQNYINYSEQELKDYLEGF